MNSAFDTYFTGLKNKKIAVLGLGVSNRPLVRLLLEYGCDVVGCDRTPREKMDAEVLELEAMGCRLHVGDGYLDDVEADILFRTPGMHPNNPAIETLRSRGAEVTSEMEAFFEVCPCPIIGVTGSDGKTTTTTLIYKCLAEEYGEDNVFVGGNIGKPLLPELDKMSPETFAVVELSSFQLQTMKASPDISIITNISPNHLDYHRGMEEYIRAKENIFLHAKPGSVAVLNGVNPVTKELGKDVPTGTEVRYFLDGIADVKDGYITYDGKPVLAASDILIPGRHNIENYTGVICALHGLVSDETVRKIAKTFGGVEHRIELVRTLDGVKYYNSSIDSSPTRTTAALNSFPGRVIVICGGYDKHIPFEPLAKPLCEKAKAVVLTGATAGKIKAALTSYPGYTPGSPEIAEEPDFEKAVLAAKSLAKPGDTVILSPACASFDAFPNFEVRGNRFKSIVNGF
ncbi:MAG: UDP-N-acetylmuramoylalanine--D-glutamate ligase [Firmicutes bacterium CAG:110_56_8]|nr:MAG: UDP-N-acetylmuramoylalanine--D-glutamate ligase [Firmicutes bacterium CAG:110_56_8]